MSVIVNRQINTLLRYLVVTVYMKGRKFYFMELLISLGEYYQCDRSQLPKIAANTVSTQNTCNHHLPSSKFLGKDPGKNCK